MSKKRKANTIVQYFDFDLCNFNKIILDGHEMGNSEKFVTGGDHACALFELFLTLTIVVRFPFGSLVLRKVLLFVLILL